MQLVLILAVLAALALSQEVPNQPVAGAGARVAIAVAGMMGVALFAAVASGMTANGLRRDFDRRSVLLRRFKHLRTAHVVLWLATAGAIFWWLDWGQMVRFNWHLNRAFLLDELLILVPVVVPIVLSWAAFYEVDHAVRANMAGSGEPGPPPATRRQYMGVHLRHYLGILLLPILGLLAVQDGAELLVPGLLESDFALALYGPAFLALFLFFPVILRYLWRTRPLEPGTLRERLESTATRSGLAVREILIWQTDGLLVNAAVAGFTGRLRYVFLTDGLLQRLTEEEIETVFGHELGHVRHRHLLLRVLAMIAPLSVWILVEQWVPDAGHRVGTWLTQGGLGLQAPLGLLLVAALGAYMFVVFGFYSRWLEHQADLFACRGPHDEGGLPQLPAFVSGLEKLAVSSGTHRKTRGWQHASIARRVEFLNRAAEDAGYRGRFHRRVGLLNLVVIAAVLSPVACTLLVG